MRYLLLLAVIFSCKSYNKQDLLIPQAGVSSVQYSINQTAVGKDSIKVLDETFYKTELFTRDFKIETPQGDLNWNKGYYYQSDEGAVSIINGDVIGTINGMELNSRDNIAFLSSIDSTLEFECHSPMPNYTIAQLKSFQDEVNNQIRTNAYKEVTLYWELRNDMITAKGGAQNAVDFITAVFNVVQGIYKKDGIFIKLAGIYAWTSADPYPATNTYNILTEYTKKMNVQRANLHHLIGMPTRVSGGIAWLNVLCSTSHNCAFSEIQNSYSTTTYSWTANVLAHETGHNLGSPHTHACSWPGGPIDGCAPTVNSAYAEGNCTAGPIPTKGTIMSYCHLIGNVGIDPFGLGFGPLPKNLILNRISASPCVTEVGEPVNPVNPTLPALCAVKSNTKYEWIDETVINGKAFKTGNNGGYYSSNDTINVNDNFVVSVTTAWKEGKAYNKTVGVFIDINRDGTLSSDEAVSLSPPSKTPKVDLPVPKLAAGIYRLRIVMDYKSATPCNTLYGEVEDYIVKATTTVVPPCIEPSISIDSPKSGEYFKTGQILSGTTTNAIKTEIFINNSLYQTLTTANFSLSLPERGIESIVIRAVGCKTVEVNKKLKWE